MVQGICKTITDYTAQGSMPFWYSIRDCVPIAYDALLLIIFIVLFAGNYFLVANKTGRAKILIALLSSSIVTLVLSVMLVLAQLVHYATAIFYALLVIIIFILFLVSDNT